MYKTDFLGYTKKNLKDRTFFYVKKIIVFCGVP